MTRRSGRLSSSHLTCTWLVLVASALLGCSDDGETPAAGSAGTTSGGGAANAGATATGGTTVSGGTSPAGGTDSVGGNGATGGTVAVGGSAGNGAGGSPVPGGPRVATVAEPLDLTPAPGMAGPALKVDFDIAGRPTTEVTELGYVAWPIEAGQTASKTIDGVTFTLKKAGSNGTELVGVWQKAAVQNPNYARLAGDGVSVSEGTAGSQIQMTIKGLKAGMHSLLSWHNVPGATKGGKVTVQVDGVTQGPGVQETNDILTNEAAPSSYVTFAATAGRDVVILFSSTATLVINGFELDTPDLAMQATTPSPTNGDEHVDADKGSISLKWKAATGSASQDVYFGTSPNSVQAATHTSPEFKGNQPGTTFDVDGLSNIDRYYWRIDEVDATGNVTRGNVWYFRPRHLAFPGAEGYGRLAIGGRGGIVVHVTNLNDSGAGSFRDAVETARGPRTIVFDVGGVIKLSSRLTLNQSYVTVAGQTAPGKGIVFRSAPFGMAGVEDVVVRHMRVRLGAGPTFDGSGLNGSNHSIVDHSSISWTIDEGFSSRSARNITLQRTLISECLNVAGHQNYPAGTAHGYAGTISGNLGSFHHNLLAHCEGRNFSMGSAIDGANVFASRLDLFNNVVYNFGGRANDGQVHQANFVNNYYKKGPATKIDFTFSMDLENYGIGTLQAYYAGNILQNANGSFKCDGTDKSCGRRSTLTNGNPQPTWEIFPTSGPFFPSYATIDSAKDAFKKVLSDVGNTLPMLDDHDARVIKETLDGTTTYKGSVSGIAGLPDKESDVGGYESYPNEKRAAEWDTDGDGLPNWWETAEGLEVNSTKNDFAEANTDFDGDGYTELEEYLNFVGEPHFVTTPGKTVSVDLKKFFAGFVSSPTYASPDAENGTTAISGTNATFTPGSCGKARFSLKVTDKDGSSMTRDVFVFVDAGRACD